ncbi:glutamate racemase [Stappia sp. ES.058]|uniref:glutamate racemase n=1 Tax=Stappia sp. ES.058 TaxID=1881061 RepID=UPI00087AE613|nr:glutamate racemase [Stappia sp. ES.058]SDU23618.1 glutamate racemase [Stappia sp. ES.058]
MSASVPPAPPVLVFDSGAGGMSVARQIRCLLPWLPVCFVADDAGFPYGDWPEEALTAHCVELLARLVDELRPCAVVIACNTASTLVLAPLRARVSIPVVGTVPAIKPAAERSRSGLVTVLATPATVIRDYTFDLIRRFAPDTAITLVGARRLAGLAEDLVAGREVDLSVLAEEIAPCFVEKNGARTDVVVLACTHYPLLLPQLMKVAPWEVDWLDPAPAIARRLANVLGEAAMFPQAGAALPAGADRVIATTGTDMSRLLALLAHPG